MPGGARPQLDMHGRMQQASAGCALVRAYACKWRGLLLLQLQQVLDHSAGVHAIPEPPSPHGSSVGPVRRDSIPWDVVLRTRPKRGSRRDVANSVCSEEVCAVRCEEVRRSEGSLCVRASNSSRSALSFCKPCDGLGTPCAARLLATSSAHATRHRVHTTNATCIGVLQEGCCMLPCCQQGSMPVRRAGGRATCARHMHMHMHMSHVHAHAHVHVHVPAGARSVLPGSGVAPVRRRWSRVVRYRLSPWGGEGTGRTCCGSDAPADDVARL